MTGARVRRVDRCIDRPPDYPSAAGAISAIPVLSVQRAGARLGTVPLVMRRSSVRFDRRLQVAAKNRTPPFDSVDRVVTGYARPGYRAVMAKTSKGHIQHQKRESHVFTDQPAPAPVIVTVLAEIDSPARRAPTTSCTARSRPARPRRVFLCAIQGCTPAFWPAYCRPTPGLTCCRVAPAWPGRARRVRRAG